MITFRSENLQSEHDSLREKMNLQLYRSNTRDDLLIRDEIIFSLRVSLLNK